MFRVVLWVTLLATAVSSQQDACYADNINPCLLFATLTPYEAVNDGNAKPVLIDRKYHNTRFKIC
jgi:hypothetical protein